jgi:hypothetical protein
VTGRRRGRLLSAKSDVAKTRGVSFQLTGRESYPLVASIDEAKGGALLNIWPG